MIMKILKSSFIASSLLFLQFIALSEWGPAENLRIVAYNIRHGEGVDGMIDLDRTAEVISRLNPDLVALQEVDKNCSRSGNRDLAAILGNQLNMEFRFGTFMAFQGGQYGLAVLSKFPIRKTRRIQLPPGSREPRCALEIEVVSESLGTPISFVSVHNDWIDEDFRVKQVLALDKAFETVRHPVVLAGDFNGERSER
jgi:endonuclease/exonuclease/phosphatase family metal-dependent hydrolase